MDKNKLVLPITILIASIILGGFIYVSQVSKQKSIEKQQQIAIDQEKQKEQAINACINTATISFNSYWERLCVIEKKPNQCDLTLLNAEIAKDYYKEIKDECFRKYGK